ncbi:MAG TPA: phage Gp37/Gp68 family protein [Phycisphaerae bacterium]|jgi:protein gp37|nr:phage Gp37/Gp68 family protein [Phycisphaerae bacterium]HOB75449.1 phage Gp37/Gp68 family protein [Phycisphaerae bacterium]HOJ56691.1 phage Gp37/Gp68 family protein [Phycisphaerae bacterium]HOL28438.1 phage Gp37/Gp68 family protein [Phycisphaerae bacterium]HPP22933.1 phage Gp37/Gp68 family protein [Phycisphaerae bacterium]
MAQGSSIEWTQSTWNPVVGCSKVSAGCRHCYAERMAYRLACMAIAARERGDDPGRTANYLHVVNHHGRWNNRVYLDHEALADPLGWKTPRTIFVNSMSDLFHEDVPLEFIQQVFDVMNRCPQHTFQVLTKRPQIAAEYSKSLIWTPNIWMGTSVENSLVIRRVGQLRRTDARVRFLSIEPLLGPIHNLSLAGIHWVIVGGESGPGARPMKPEWVRQIRDRCLAQGVPFFFKQWGGVNKKQAGRILDGRTWDEMPGQEELSRRKSVGTQSR